MKWFDDIRIRYKLFVVFGVLMCIMLSFALFTVTHIDSLGNSMKELVSFYNTRRLHIADAIDESFRIRVANLSIGYMLEGEGYIRAVSGYRANYDKDTDSFIKNLRAYRDNVSADPRLSEPDRRVRLDLVNAIEQTYKEYAHLTDKLPAAVDKHDKEEVVRLFSDSIPKGMELSAQLRQLRDMVVFMAGQKTLETTDGLNRVIQAILVIVVACILLSAVALLFTVRSIDRPIARLEKAITEITGGNLAYPIRDERGDELGLLANRIGDMVDGISEHNKMMAILDNMDAIINVADFDYNLLYVNKYTADTFGMDRESCLQQKCYQAIRNREKPCEFCQLSKLAPHQASLPSHGIESAWDEDLKIWISGTHSVIRWVDGSLVYLTIWRDVTQKKQQEELTQWQTKELEFQKTKLQNMFDAIPDLVFVKGLDSRFVLCNKAVGELFNCDADALVGKNELDGLGFSDRQFQHTLENDQTVFTEGRRLVTEDIIPVPQGMRHYEIIRVPLTQDGSITGLMGIVRDISAHKEMQKQQAELAHWYKSILDATPLPISVTDAEMNWTFVNKAVEDFLGARFEDMLGKPCSDWNSNICKTPDCGIACAKRGEKRTFFTHEGASYQVDVEILKTLDGDVAGFIEVAQDITRIKEMEEEARSASRAKSQFLANMSHEIRTPLNAILGITEIRLQDETLAPGIREAFSRIYTSGDMLLGIINDILDMSKIEAGRLELAPAAYEVASLINDTVQLNMMRVGSKEIAFELEVDEGIPATVVGDALRVKQILNNLLSNAFKYTARGEVKLSFFHEREGDDDRRASEENDGVTLVVVVRDTGQGMTADQVSKLFDTYARFNLETNRTIEGTGLGMSITQNLVRLMNGDIAVESVPEGGTTFTVRLPQGRAGSESLGREVAKNLRQFRMHSAANMKRVQILREPMPYGSVLVVDDMETNIYVAKGLLAPYGLTVDSAESGFEALEKIEQGNLYDIVFMDHMMPAMDGIEAAYVLRSRGYARPVVALTANAVMGQAEIFLANGFDDFISKPIDLREMNAVLNKFVRDRYPPEVVEAARRQHADAREPSVDGTPRASVDPKLAKIFIRDASKSLAALEELCAKRDALRDEDLRKYVINVHGIKSSLANIGETELAALAAGLEQAGRERDVAAMASRTPAFLDALRKVIEARAPGEDAGAGGTTDEDQAYLREKLHALRAACGAYNKKAARDALAGIGQKAWPREVQERLDAVAELLLHSKFKQVIHAVDAMTATP